MYFGRNYPNKTCKAKETKKKKELKEQVHIHKYIPNKLKLSVKN